MKLEQSHKLYHTGVIRTRFIPVWYSIKAPGKVLLLLLFGNYLIKSSIEQFSVCASAYNVSACALAISTVPCSYALMVRSGTFERLALGNYDGIEVINAIDWLLNKTSNIKT